MIKMDDVINIWSLLDDVIAGYRRELKNKLSKIDLSITDYKVLYMVKDTEKPMKCIADSLSLAKGWVTDIIDNLEEKNLIMRVHNEDDRRVIMIKITDKGMKRYNEMRQFIKDTIENSLKELDPAEIKSFENILNKLSNKMKNQVNEI